MQNVFFCAAILSLTSLSACTWTSGSPNAANTPAKTRIPASIGNPAAGAAGGQSQRTQMKLNSAIPMVSTPHGYRVQVELEQGPTTAK